MGFDIKQLISRLDQKFDGFGKKLKAYFNSLSRYELYAWIVFGVGFLMMLIALVTW